MQAIRRSLISFPRLFSSSFSSTAEDSEILIENSSPFFTKLMINRPSSLNALTYTMCKTMHELTETWSKSSTKVAFIWFF